MNEGVRSSYLDLHVTTLPSSTNPRFMGNPLGVLEVWCNIYLRYQENDVTTTFDITRKGLELPSNSWCLQSTIDSWDRIYGKGSYAQSSEIPYTINQWKPHIQSISYAWSSIRGEIYSCLTPMLEEALTYAYTKIGFLHSLSNTRMLIY
jgi:hypothetical protein